MTKQIKSGQYLLIKESVESWHYVKIARVLSVDDNNVLLTALQFTGNGSCPVAFIIDKTFHSEKNTITSRWYIFDNEIELLAKAL